jgi:hypothetical protein
VPARMEQGSQLAGPRIKPGDIWAFVPIAVQTCKCEIGPFSSASVLPGNDVVDLERGGEISLWNATILAHLSCATADFARQRFVHESPTGVGDGPLNS